jgi:hypothetical protein
MEYENLFKDYFNGFDIEIEYRGVPIRGGGRLTHNHGNCAGNPPNDLNCKGGFFCNTSIRQWQCKT